MLPFLEEHKRQGHNVSVACDAEEDATAIEAIGVSVCPYYLKRGLGISNLRKAFSSLKQVLKQSDFDLIIVHMPIAGAVTRIVAKLSRCTKSKIIYVSHGLPCAPHQSKPRWLLWFIVEWILGHMTDAMFTMNKYDYDLARKTRMLSNIDCIRKIPGMGVDLEKFSANITSPFDSFWKQFGVEHKKVILCVARLVREKGIFELLQAAQLLAKKDYAFVLVGDGPDSREVSQFAMKHNLDNVFLLGHRKDVYEFTKRCDLFVLPTYYFEGLPVTLLEAMGCSKPIISTHHRGCEDVVVDGQTGYLVDVRSPRQLADKIEAVLEDESLGVKMGAAGRKRVESCFSLEWSVKMFCDEISYVSRYW